MRILWKGFVTFGLINIPMNVYSGVKVKVLPLHLLHAQDHSPIRYARICQKDHKEVPWEDIVKGYRLETGDYVILNDQDFEKIAPKQQKTIEIQSFAYESEIDTIYYESFYYLEPQKGASKAYALLREALKKSKKVAIAYFVFKNKEHLAIIKPYKESLILQQLRFHSEMRAYNNLEIPKADHMNAKELTMATQLVDNLTETFNPKNYHDTYHEALTKIIDAKAKGKKIKTKSKRIQSTKITDISDILKQSLKKTKKRKAA